MVGQPARLPVAGSHVEVTKPEGPVKHLLEFAMEFVFLGNLGLGPLTERAFQDSPFFCRQVATRLFASLIAIPASVQASPV